MVGLAFIRLGQLVSVYASHAKFLGVRHIVQDESDPDFILQKDFLAAVKKLESLDCLVICPSHYKKHF